MKGRHGAWIALLSVALTTAGANAQSVPNNASTLRVLAVSRTVVTGSVQCKACLQMSDEGGDIHEFEVGDALPEGFAAIKSAKSSLFLPAARTTAPKIAPIGDSEANRACGGTSECHTDWQSGPCHVACSGGLDNLALQAVARRTVREGDVQAIARFLQESNGSVRLNVERSALQILGCNGTVAVHLPIASRLTASVSALIDVLIAENLQQ
jgi:hypothetical protein